MTEFVTTPEDGRCTVTVSGEVDIASASELITAGLTCLESGTPVLEVDLAAVSFIDSSGLGALVRIRNEAARRGTSVSLTNVPDPVRRLFELSGLLEVFDVRPVG